MRIIVSETPLNIGELSQRIKPRLETGGVASFTGYMRNNNVGRNVSGMFLDHYPEMTEAALQVITDDATKRWPLHNGLVAHRVGNVLPGDLLVYVETHAEHRQAAFDACNFIMDTLKTSAPFWKKETSDNNEHWVEQRDSDLSALKKW